MSPEKIFILNNEGISEDLLQFVTRLKTDAELKRFYILSIAVWFNYFKICLNDKTQVENRHINGRRNDLKELKRHFSQSEWPELFQSATQLDSYIKQLQSKGLINPHHECNC